MRYRSRALLSAYAAVVLVITWWPSPQSSAAPRWEQSVLELVRGLGVPATMPVLEALANVAMFFPLGVLFALVIPVRGWRAGKVVAAAAGAGAGFSTVIELVQLGIPGRYSTLQDVVMNTIGGVVGAGLVAGLRATRGR